MKTACMLNYTNEITALVSLLDDPDAKVSDPVVDRLVEIGSPAIKILENCWEKTFDNQVQTRIENILTLIQRAGLKKDFKDWADCRGEQLLYGASLIARITYPELDYNEIDETVERMKNEIWLELNNRLTALEKVKIINHFLYNVHNFNRSIRGVQSPSLYYINQVLETRKGLPVSLAVIYAELANRLELPIYCVDLPMNFLLAYQDDTYDHDPDGILFYINPYTRGSVLGRREVENFLIKQNIQIKQEYTRPCSNISSIHRLAEGLRFALSVSGDSDKHSFLEELIQVMKSKEEDQSL